MKNVGKFLILLTINILRVFTYIITIYSYSYVNMPILVAMYIYLIMLGRVHHGGRRRCP